MAMYKSLLNQVLYHHFELYVAGFLSLQIQTCCIWNNVYFKIYQRLYSLSCILSISDHLKRVSGFTRMSQVLANLSDSYYGGTFSGVIP